MEILSEFIKANRPSEVGEECIESPWVLSDELRELEDSARCLVAVQGQVRPPNKVVQLGLCGPLRFSVHVDS